LPVLDFSGDTSGGGGADGFYEYHSAVILTHAGCYRLAVTWDGGEWYTIFAAGVRT
jgi:hypothetical protein